MQPPGAHQLQIFVAHLFCCPLSASDDCFAKMGPGGPNWLQISLWQSQVQLPLTCLTSYFGDRRCKGQLGSAHGPTGTVFDNLVPSTAISLVCGWIQDFSKPTGYIMHHDHSMVPSSRHRVIRTPTGLQNCLLSWAASFNDSAFLLY